MLKNTTKDLEKPLELEHSALHYTRQLTATEEGRQLNWQAEAELRSSVMREQ